MTKSKAAFMLTCDRMFKSHSKVYFWTITFYELHDDWECSRRFSKFIDLLRKRIGNGWGGVRVSELHKERGVHYHMLITRRIPADVVRAVGRYYGIGRVHACVADTDASAYLGKYLSKQREGAKTESGRSARKWAKFGQVEHVRVSDLVNDSPMWLYRREKKLPFLGYWQEKILTRCWDHGEKSFHAAYVALTSVQDCGRDGDAFKIAEGKLEARGIVTLVERQPKGLRPF
jgi:hypothetical protein